jgi:hypothetical protein
MSFQVRLSFMTATPALRFEMNSPRKLLSTRIRERFTLRSHAARLPRLALPFCGDREAQMQQSPPVASRNAGGAEAVAVYWGFNSRIGDTAAHHAPDILARHGRRGKLFRFADGRAE